MQASVTQYRNSNFSKQLSNSDMNSQGGLASAISDYQKAGGGSASLTRTDFRVNQNSDRWNNARSNTMFSQRNQFDLNNSKYHWPLRIFFICIFECYRDFQFIASSFRPVISYNWCDKLKGAYRIIAAFKSITVKEIVINLPKWRQPRLEYKWTEQLALECCKQQDVVKNKECCDNKSTRSKLIRKRLLRVSLIWKIQNPD